MLYVPPQKNLTPRLSWKVFKEKGRWCILGIWGLADTRISTPVQSIEDKGDHYFCSTESGSTYILMKEYQEENSNKMQDMMKDLEEEETVELDFEVPEVEIEYQEDDGNSNCDGGGCTI